MEFNQRKQWNEAADLILSVVSIENQSTQSQSINSMFITQMMPKFALILHGFLTSGMLYKSTINNSKTVSNWCCFQMKLIFFMCKGDYTIHPTFKWFYSTVLLGNWSQKGTPFLFFFQKWRMILCFLHLQFHAQNQVNNKTDNRGE